MSEEILFSAKFEGHYADDHVVPAYNTVSALYGITRGILIPVHYLTEEKVRRRNIQSPKYNLFITPPKSGSVDFPFHLALGTLAVLASNPISVGVTVNLISEFITNSIKRAVGKDSEIISNEIERKIDEGTKDAIAAALEPSLRKGHNIINNGVINININSNGGDVLLDNSTKTYLNNFTTSPHPKTRMMSVSSYNANSKTGGAFDLQEGRVLPFKLTGKPDATTLRTIVSSQSTYVNFQISNDKDDRESAFVAIQHLEIRDSNDKLKRIEVIKARHLFNDI